MAKKTAFSRETAWTKGKPKKTSIGKSSNSRPTNKHKKKNWKKYRGQGK